METTDQLLEDFLVFLAREGLIEMHETRSGDTRLGARLQTAKEILDNYWESFQ